MKSDKETTGPKNLDALGTQYKAAISMLAHTNTRRTATARFYITLISGLVGLITLVNKPGVDTETQMWTTDFICLFGILLSCIWFFSVRALRNTAHIQRSLLSKMEEQLPFAFITQQEELIATQHGWLKSGEIEQWVPAFMMTPSILVLLLTHL